MEMPHKVTLVNLMRASPRLVDPIDSNISIKISDTKNR